MAARLTAPVPAAANDSPLDWSAPWLAPFAALRSAVEASDWRAALTSAAHEAGVQTAGVQTPVVQASGAQASGAQTAGVQTAGVQRAGVQMAQRHPIEFVAPDDAPAGVAYESHIAATGRVPSRDNRHDRFNAMMWIAFPHTKAALNARQAAEIARDGVGGRRGAVRDAATLIDESALLLACDDGAPFDALARRDWRALLIDERARWGRDIVPLVFGHALLEKLAGPYKAITAAVVPAPLAGGNHADIDHAAARFIARADLAPTLLAHLPVLGIPGWWPDNADPAFYADARVFRPALKISGRQRARACT